MRRLSLQYDVGLQSCNSLRLPARAAQFLRVDNTETLEQALEFAREERLPVLVIGSGSNIVMAGDFPGLVLKVALRGRSWSQINGDAAILELGAGENWHDTVNYAVGEGYRGIENLALIPGTVGAAPIQNIGAYGVELSDTLIDVTVWDRTLHQQRVMTNHECRFAYRDSIFKQQPDDYVVLKVRLALSRSRRFQLDYRDLEDYFGHQDARNGLTAKAVANAVTRVRRDKLPDPDLLPNAGSFFKNPVVPMADYEALKNQFSEIVAYPGKDTAKLAAAWLIDQCGWKGYRETHVGVHNRQALVLVHHGDGSGEELLALARRIRDNVKSRFGVSLEIEPRIFPLEARASLGFD
jgi:UDP-N-acetylmuramate dehydrogenase